MSLHNFQKYLDEVLVDRRSMIFCCSNKSKEEIMKWQNNVIKKPLTNINEEQSPYVLQLFKNLLGYLGEIKTSKASLPHIKKFLKNAYESSQEVKDEVYLHCWKQLSGHTEQTYGKGIKAWKALALVSSCITPSSKLFYSLLNQLLFEIKSVEDVNTIRHANYIFARLHRIYSKSRKFIPTTQEIEYIEKLKSIPVTVGLFSGEDVIVPVESYTSMRELKELVMRKIGFNTNKTLHYGIYELKKTNQGTIEGFIEEDEILCDLFAIWDKELEEAYKKKDNVEFKLILREKNFIDTSDDETLSYRYHQFAYDYITGKFQVESDKVIGFASIKLFIEFPDSSDYNQAFNQLNENFNSYVPDYIDGYNQDDWCQKIMELYSNLKDREEAKKLFLEKLQEGPFYNANFFDVKFSDKNQTQQEINFPEDLLLSLKQDRIIIYDKNDDSVLGEYAYNKIINWGISSIYFVFVLPQEDELISKIYLETPHTKIIHNIIEIYVNLLCGKSNNEVESIIKQNEKKFEGLISYREKTNLVFTK